jgi:hypothetical protein
MKMNQSPIARLLYWKKKNTGSPLCSSPIARTFKECSKHDPISHWAEGEPLYSISQIEEEFTVLIRALQIAEGALTDIKDLDHGFKDDLVWAKKRTEQVLPIIQNELQNYKEMISKCLPEKSMDTTSKTSSLIQPSDELMEQWVEESRSNDCIGADNINEALTKAAQWGAEEELKACINIIENTCSDSAVTADPNLIDKHILIDSIVKLRKPKPLTLKQQALEMFDKAKSFGSAQGLLYSFTSQQMCDLRKILEDMNDI